MIQGEDKDNLKADLFHFQNIRVVFFFTILAVTTWC